MEIQCEMKVQPALPTLSVRTRTPVEGLPQLIGQTYGRIAQYIGEAGGQPAGMPYIAYYNMDMQDLDIEIGFPVSQPLPARGDIQPGALPAGRVASCLFKGPYQELGDAYQALTGFVKEQGCEPTGISYEFYYNDPSVQPYEVPITEVVFPLKSG